MRFRDSMRFFCPQCLKVVDLERSALDWEIVSAYCLHSGARFGGGSEVVRMESAPISAAIISEPASVSLRLNSPAASCAKL